MSKNCISFKRVIFARGVVHFNGETKQKYVLPKLVECYSIISFGLWMSNGEHDIFALVINFLKVDWQPKHITIGLFETSEITKQVLVRNLITLCDEYGLKKMIVAYVKK